LEILEEDIKNKVKANKEDKLILQAKEKEERLIFKRPL
jgi:hypothetical protein